MRSPKDPRVIETGERPTYFYVDGIHMIERLSGAGVAYVSVTYYSIASPRMPEARVLPVCVIRPQSALLWQDGGIGRWLREQQQHATAERMHV